MIVVDKLTKTFASVKAVDNLSFSIGKGEVVGFLGPNGAGKTTTMRLITGFFFPDSGSVSVDGKLLSSNLLQIQKQIGYLPENNPLYKDMLVSEMLNYSADLKDINTKNKKKTMDFVVDAVGIANVFYRPISELSKGYRQRVGMATALLNQPQILIMDEPTEGLDPNQRTEIRALIKKLRKDRTIIISTHVMQEAAAVSDRILIINQGKLVADGTPDQLTQTGKNEKSFELVIQGKKIKTLISTLPSIVSLDVSRPDQGKTTVDLTTKSQASIQPLLAQLAADNNWVIWKLVEKQHNLEEVFANLTQS